MSHCHEPGASPYSCSEMARPRWMSSFSSSVDTRSVGHAICMMFSLAPTRSVCAPRSARLARVSTAPEIIASAMPRMRASSPGETTSSITHQPRAR